MGSRFSLRRSLKTRVTLFTLVIFVLSIFLLSFYLSRALKQDMQRLLGERQFSTAAFIAAEINGELSDRLEALEGIAKQVNPDLMSNPTALQALLEQRPILLAMFNGGIFVTDVDGTAISDLPLSNGRIGTNYMDRESVSIPLKQGKTVIGRPAMGKKLGAPIFSIVAPIRDVAGAVIGALVGTINLGNPNFLDKVTHSGFGATGTYLLNAPQYRLVITGTDKTRIMQALPPPGVNTMLDRYVLGYEGYGVSVNSKGVEELTAAKNIPIAGWFLGVIMPTAEAFAPINAMQHRTLWVAILLTLLAGGLTWWMLRLQLAPMLSTAQTLALLATTNQPAHALPVTYPDEIGGMVAGFNHLLGVLEKREVDLRLSEKFRVAILNSLESQVAVLDSAGVIVGINDAWCSFARENSVEPGRAATHTEVGVNYLDMCQTTIGPATDGALEAREGIQKVLKRRLPVFTLEYPCNSPTEPRWFRMVVTPLTGAVDGAVIIHTNITQRKLMEEKLRLTSNVFTYAKEGILITDAAGNIIEVNDAFTAITGYDRAQVMGKNPRILRSGRHDSAFYASLWCDLKDRGFWSGEIWNRRSNGEIYPELVTISAVRDDKGVALKYVSLFSDITERKYLEGQVRQMAFFDPLTQLPNRRLLDDRLTQSLAASKRSGLYGALMFLDLDNFKPLNDAQGHGVGDLLLIEVARRLTACVRETDSVARLGGDEFVVLLSELDTDKSQSFEQASVVAEKIRAALATPYQLAVTLHDQPLTTVEHHCSASIGVVVFLNHEVIPMDLMKYADVAMYQAKEAGRNTVKFYASNPKE